MIKFDSERPQEIKFTGSSKDLAIEIGALAKTIYDVIKGYNEDIAEDYHLNLFNAIFVAFENNTEEQKRLIAEHEKHMEMINKLRSIRDFLNNDTEEINTENNKSEIKDIRRAEFDSDEEFTKWFHGGE